MVSNHVRWVLMDRIVTTGLLVGLLAKLHPLFIGFRIYRELPLHDSFFPSWLQESDVYLVAYLLAIGLSAATLVIRSLKALLVFRLMTVCSLYVLCIHQGSYNDVTFFTGFWTGVWQLWFSIQLVQNRWEGLETKAITVAHLIISMIFLGGAVGKFTEGYWNGDVLYNIYYVDRNYWPFQLMRDWYSESQLREIAVWHSRFTIFMESLCACLWLMPARTASWIAFVALFSIAAFSNPYLFSVVGPLMGLAVLGILIHPNENHRESCS